MVRLNSACSAEFSRCGINTDIQADWACGSSAHGQTDSQLFSTLLSHVMYWQVCLYVCTYCYVDVCIRVG